MALRLSVDTTFLIDLQRDRSAGVDDGAAQGSTAPSTNHRRHARGSQPCPVDDEIALVYARVVRELRRRGELIGTNDLWIGCASLRLGMPIVTANIEHFRRIDGLRIVQYR